MNGQLAAQPERADRRGQTDMVETAERGTSGATFPPSSRPSATSGGVSTVISGSEAVDLLAIKDLGGWRSLAMVQRYAHLSPAHRREAIERLVTRAKTAETAPAAGAE